MNTYAILNTYTRVHTHIRGLEKKNPETLFKLWFGERLKKG